MTNGQTATRRISFFDASNFRSKVAAECDFAPAEHGLTAQQIDRMGRATQFAYVAAVEALEMSGFEVTEENSSRFGVSVGSAVGSVRELDANYRALSDDGRLWELDHHYASPHLLDYQSTGATVREIAWLTGAQGPSAMISAGCTSGLDTIGHAFQLIQEGSADTVIAGATDAPITPITAACFDAIKATTRDNDDAEHASKPFDRRRNGFVLGEGAAMFVLENYETAKARGADIIAEVGGFASRCNAHHMTGLLPDGKEMAESIRDAMRQARVDASDIDYINAHGSGTKQNDRHETAAYKRSLGNAAYETPVSSIKSMIGHSLGAIGSIELAACALAIRHGVIPPTANLHEPDPECDLDYVPLIAREQRTDVVLSVGSGFGGFQSAAILTREGR